jgi:hypothetical protein
MECTSGIRRSRGWGRSGDCTRCAGNVEMFPSTLMLVQRVEYEWAGSRQDTVAFNKKHPVKLINGDYDIFGDGSLVLLSTPGHTPGHQSLLVRSCRRITSNGQLATRRKGLVGSDTSWSKLTDLLMAAKGLPKLCGFSEDNCVEQHSRNHRRSAAHVESY